jgi:methylmalonyl-CoA mutase
MAEHPDLQKWIDLASKQMKGKPLESLNWDTPEGIRVKPLYTAEDLEAIEHLNTARWPPCMPAAPGPSGSMPVFPPPRNPTNSTARIWPPVRRVCRLPSDLATHRGYDSDHPRVPVISVKPGVAIDSVEDMKILFDGRSRWTRCRFP